MNLLRDSLLWEKLYDVILDNLGLSRDKDYYACLLLDLMLSTRVELVFKSRMRLLELLRDRDVIVVGDSPGSSCPSEGGKVLVVADSALGKCLKKGTIPAAVVTDLDGVTPDMLRLEEVVYVIHAHGDNIENVRTLLPRVRGFLVGTAQHFCSPRVDVPGGFTDGDRAVYLALSYGAKRVYLYGFDFNSVGRLFKPSGVGVNVKAKLAKLAWARLLLQLLKYGGYSVECLEGGCEGWVQTPLRVL